MRKYRDYLIERLADREKAISYLQTALEEYRNDVHKQSILVPPLSEQKAIVSLLETWDTAIEKTEALIAAKEKQFKWLLKIHRLQYRHHVWHELKDGGFGLFRSGLKFRIRSLKRLKAYR